jgi:hypothetical protein
MFVTLVKNAGINSGSDLCGKVKTKHDITSRGLRRRRMYLNHRTHNSVQVAKTHLSFATALLWH